MSKTVGLTLLVLMMAATGVEAIDLGSWDHIYPAGSRFEVLAEFADQAVLDRETGLVWERWPSQAERTWLEARQSCIDKAVGDKTTPRMGWRLPAIHELASLIDPMMMPGPTLPAGHPFINVAAYRYWTASKRALQPPAINEMNVWKVNFSDGQVIFDGVHSWERFGLAWCVRGGVPGPDKY